MKNDVLHLVVHPRGLAKNVAVEVHLPGVAPALLLARLESLVGHQVVTRIIVFFSKRQVRREEHLGGCYIIRNGFQAVRKVLLLGFGR